MTLCVVYLLFLVLCEQEGVVAVSLQDDQLVVEFLLRPLKQRLHLLTLQVILVDDLISLRLHLQSQTLLLER